MPRVIGAEMPSVTVDDASGTPQDIKGEVIDFSYEDSDNLLDTTTVDTTDMQREYGLHDFTCTFNVFVNTDTNSTYDVFLKSKRGKRTIKVALTSSLFVNGEMAISSVSTSRDSDSNLTASVSMEQAGPVTAIHTTS